MHIFTGVSHGGWGRWWKQQQGTTAPTGHDGKQKTKKQTSGEQCAQISNRACTHTVTQTRSLAHSETNHTTYTCTHKQAKHLLSKKQYMRRYKHTVILELFHPPIQLTRLKKKHKNKLHKYFLPSLFFTAPLPCFMWCCFSLSLFCPVFCRMIWCGAMSSGVSDARPHRSCLTPYVPLNADSKLEGQKVI